MKLFFLVCIFSVSQGVFAAGKLTIEPYLGVGTFKQSETFSTTLGTDFDASFDDSGTGIAGRVSILVETFLLKIPRAIFFTMPLPDKNQVLAAVA